MGDFFSHPDTLKGGAGSPSLSVIGEESAKAKSETVVSKTDKVNLFNILTKIGVILI
jgi:hypothetical protein